MLAESKRELGGRVTRESRLPGLSEWIRVRDYRIQQIQSMPNVDIYLESSMSAGDVLAAEADHVVIATGAQWRVDGVGITRDTPIETFSQSEQIFTPDDIMSGRLPDGPTVIYDDDHYYMASVIAEKLRALNLPVTFITPKPVVCAWGEMTTEQARVQRRLLELEVALFTSHNLTSFDGRTVLLECVYSQRQQNVVAEAVVTVTSRLPNDSLYWELQQSSNAPQQSALKSITRIGDCEAPAIIAGAVFSGHRYAREFETEIDRENPIKYDRVFFEEDFDSH